MGGFFLARSPNPRETEGLLEAAQERFRRHGFRAFTPLATPTHRGFHVGYINGGPETVFERGEDFVAVAGTLAFDGKVGRPALEALLDAFTIPFTGWERLEGQFGLLVHKDGQTAALTDYFGAFQIFHDPEQRLLSTSFLAAAEALPRVRWDVQGVYEFAFNVFPIGDDTVVKEVRRLGPETMLELGETVQRHAMAKPLPARVSREPLPERLARSVGALKSAAAPFVAAFGDRMQVPLSGGLDSRLALALLRSEGVQPHVYVYGSAGDTDVRIARRIGAGESFEVEAFNKAGWRRIEPDEFPEIVARNFDETDALVTDGGLFDNGGNAFARHARQADGQLAVSGGCGEVFRNFFYLSDRRFRAHEVARAFFARFVRSDTTGEFDARAFVRNVEKKLAHALGRPPRAPLSRIEVEQLYPRVRCRAFFGREISLVGRHGAYFMPFLDHRVVEQALRVPMRLKSAGRFEAMLLASIDPRLAAYESAYGHHFAEPPSREHRMSELSTVVRPTWLRQRSYWLRRRLGPLGDEHGGLLTPAFLGRVLDLHFPAMSRFFHVAAVDDKGLYRRIATLEYLAQHLGSRLAA